MDTAIPAPERTIATDPAPDWIRGEGVKGENAEIAISKQ
jgi:hypothetical protein